MDISVFQNLSTLRYHPDQSRLWASQARFQIVTSGRRSGKTEISGKRKFVLMVLYGTNAERPRYFAGAPTTQQARRIYWKDLKKLTKPYWARKPNETRMQIDLITGAEIHVLGLDVPERVEGDPWDGCVLDEYANMKKEVWKNHVRPALSTPGRPPGWAYFIGVPEGMNHYYDLVEKTKQRMIEEGENSPWQYFHWISADILDPNEIEEARRDLDELTYLQEYEGTFVNFSGRAYYNFDESKHCVKLNYDPNGDLIFCFDFNVSPGVAVVVQEQNYIDPHTMLPIVGKYVSGIIGEVYIPRNSNTVSVCKKLIADWGHHRGEIFLYGDSTGGSKGSAKIIGTDWDIITAMMNDHYGVHRINMNVPATNPRERLRVNSVNSRFLNLMGEIRIQIDPSRAPYTKKDFDAVTVLEGGSGEIDKKSDLTKTHLSDSFGYYIAREYPAHGGHQGLAKISGF